MTRICQTCSQPNPPVAAFCLNCAAPLAQEQFGAPPNNQQWNRQSIPAPQSGGVSQRATAALLLAVAGLVCCGPLTSVPAMIVGWMEIDAIKKGQSSAEGMRLAQIGLWGGAAITAVQTVGFLFWLLLSMAASPYDY